MNNFDKDQLIKFQNKWVAISKNKNNIVLAGKTFGALTKKLKKFTEKDQKDLTLMHILPLDRYYSPYGGKKH